MAYFSGTTNSFADLKTTLETLLTSNGWATSDGILNKDGAYIKFTSTTTELMLQAGTGQSTSTITGAQPNDTRPKVMSNTTNPFTWPINYEFFLFNNPHEWYLVLNYNSEYYQHLHFGFGDVPGNGTLNFYLDGSHGALASNSVSQANNFAIVDAVSYIIYIDDSRDGNMGGFFTEYSSNSNSDRPGAIYNSLNSVGWKHWQTNTETEQIKYGNFAMNSALLYALPNILNQTTVLLPIKVLVGRGSSLVSLSAEMRNARLCRIDNIEAGSILTYGADQWKIFPLYRRNVSARNGGGSLIGSNHSGTFGVAIRYDGV